MESKAIQSRKIGWENHGIIRINSLNQNRGKKPDEENGEIVLNSPDRQKTQHGEIGILAPNARLIPKKQNRYRGQNLKAIPIGVNVKGVNVKGVNVKGVNARVAITTPGIVIPSPISPLTNSSPPTVTTANRMISTPPPMNHLTHGKRQTSSTVATQFWPL
jgi:hypothetical protein